MSRQGWLEVLGKTRHPPSELPLERACMGDLLRLGRTRSKAHEALENVVEKLTNEAPLLGSRSLAQRITKVTKQARECISLDIELYGGLASYKLDLTTVLQLPSNWWEKAREEYWGVDERLEELVGLAMRA